MELESGSVELWNTHFQKRDFQISHFEYDTKPLLVFIIKGNHDMELEDFYNACLKTSIQQIVNSSNGQRTVATITTNVRK